MGSAGVNGTSCAAVPCRVVLDRGGTNAVADSRRVADAVVQSECLNIISRYDLRRRIRNVEMCTTVDVKVAGIPR